MRKISRLAIKDYLNEWQISSCYILALAAVLGPMMVLFALKFGIVTSMFDQLLDNPVNRELRPIYSGHFDKSWLEQLQKRPDVGFLVPKTRNLAASMLLKSKNAPSIINVELIPTAENDPLLSGIKKYPEGFDSIILSKSAAKKLAVGTGDTIQASVQRHYLGIKEQKQLSLKVLAVANSQAFTREGAFASVKLLEAFESYKDGQAVAELNWTGSQPTNAKKFHPSFRLFSQTINDVEGLQKWLETQGVEVITQVEEIKSVQQMDNTLSTIYWAIAMIGIIGFSTSLGANLWANVERKRKELSIIRVIGFSTFDITIFPIIQSLLTVFFGWLLSVVIYLGISFWINSLMSNQLEAGIQVCVLLPQHYFISLFVAAVLAVLVATVAGVRAAYIDPAEGMREI
ncbi:MAG: hypothetical protein L3J59_05545 [Methylococcaceae bacterium]|nr:hypothetical protein [Methylococcaceae bacterium]